MVMGMEGRGTYSPRRPNLATGAVHDFYLMLWRRGEKVGGVGGGKGRRRREIVNGRDEALGECLPCRCYWSCERWDG
jgi:hypothetical protein